MIVSKANVEMNHSASQVSIKYRPVKHVHVFRDTEFYKQFKCKMCCKMSRILDFNGYFLSVDSAYNFWQN